MGSRIMHIIIANKIADSLAINDKTPFLLGSIAPDAVSSKDSSHFFAGDLQDYSRCVDYQAFIHMYHTQKENHYLLGYYTHLIADDIWLKGFYLPWLKNRMAANHEMFNLYHNDFKLLNGKLLEHYGFKEELCKALRQSQALIDLDEVKTKDVNEFIPYVIGDMDYDINAVISEKLHVFTLEQIIGYIETCVDIGLLKIKALELQIHNQLN